MASPTIGKTIFLADDHTLVAQGIASLLSNLPGVEEVRIFKNGLELYNACHLQQPDYIFLDIEMPLWDGRKTLIEICKHFPDIHCIILSMLNERAIIEDCIQKGASAYLNKNCMLDEIAEAISAVAENRTYFSSEIRKVMEKSEKSSLQSFFLSERLSEREVEVLKLICDGMSPKETAEKLFLSHRTVEVHKNNIMQKFGVNSVGKLISLAIKNKVV